MTARAPDDLATLLEPARAALDDDALVERSVRLARSRTLLAARGEVRGRGPARRLFGAFGGKLALACAVLAVTLVSSQWLLRTRTWGGSDSPPASIAYAVGSTTGVIGERIAAPLTSRTLEFTDGTRVDVDAGGAMRVISLDERGGRLLLEQGTVRASFRHRERTYWTVEAGGVVVEVTGTRFDVRWDQAAQTFELDMHEGSVRVHGCGLEAGGVVRVVKDVETARASCALPSAPPRDEPSAPAPVAIPTLKPSDLPSVARERSSLPGVSAATLMTRADAERRAHESNAARATLLEVRQRFPRSREAAHAAFDLGVVAFDLEDRLADAASWFRRYLAEAPSGSLAREASGRLVEALDRSGDSAAAAKAAAFYLEMYPGGPHASLAKRLVASSP